MKNHRKSLIAIAVHAALLALAQTGYAADTDVDPAVAELTTPASTVDAGIGYVSKGSYKFGEYNGLEKQGAFGIADLDLRGGGSYDSDSALRWRLLGSDLGLKTRSAEFELRDQGTFKLDLGFRDLLRNYSDTYQTPYLGAGTSTFTLPGNWVKPVEPQVSATGLNFRSLSPTVGAGSVVSPTGAVVGPTDAQRAILSQIVTNDAGAYHHVNLQTERKRGDLGFGLNLSPHLELSGSVRHETRNGLQALGAATSAVSENSVILPSLVDTVTDQFNLGLQYARSKGYLQVGYYGSLFKNNVRAQSWQDPNNPAKVATVSSAPSNEFHQFNAAGGYNLFSTLKLSGDVAYGRNRQNESFLSDPSLPLGLPETSANALVITRTANLKLTVRPIPRLALSAHYKYDDRDNRTPINPFVFYDVNIAKGAAASAFNAALGLAPNTIGSNVNIFDNRPQSRKLNQLDLDGDYALGMGQRLTGGFQWQKLERWCDHSWINCVNASESIERTFHGDWRAPLGDSFNVNLDYAYSWRNVHYDPNAWLALVPMANVIPGAPTVGASTSVYGYLTQTGLTGWGPTAGFPATPLTGNAALFSPNNNIVPQSLYGSRDNVSELPGMRRFDMANRKRHRLRSGIDWAASDRLSLQGTFEFGQSRYDESTYGLQKSSNWAVSLDGDYELGERLIVGAFYTHEDQRSKTASDAYGSNSSTAFVGRAGNTLVSGGCFTSVLARSNNAKIDPCLNWTADLRDRADTVGFSLLKKRLFWRKFDLNGEAIFTRARTDVGVSGGSYVNNPYALAGAPVLAAGVPAVYFIPAAGLPAVTTRTVELRLTGRIHFTKSAQMQLLYEYERLQNVDFAYDGMQFGTGTEQLPTLEQAPNYTVHLVGISFGYQF